MTQSKKQARNTESGFTLVELAIVMIIIGLLIGGILKGQELINNARLTSTVTQIKAFETGLNGFRDKYGALPGDIASPTTRLPNCATANSVCLTGANVGTRGNGQIEAVDPSLAPAVGNETGAVFVHLNVTGFIGGTYNPAATAVGRDASHPAIEVGTTTSVWKLATATAAPTNMMNATGLPLGIVYLSSANAIGTTSGGATGTNAFLPVSAGTIDRKLDDGSAVTGRVRAVAGNGICQAGGIYSEAVQARDCDLAIGMQ